MHRMDTERTIRSSWMLDAEQLLEAWRRETGGAYWRLEIEATGETYKYRSNREADVLIVIGAGGKEVRVRTHETDVEDRIRWMVEDWQHDHNVRGQGEG